MRSFLTKILLLVLLCKAQQGFAENSLEDVLWGKKPISRSIQFEELEKYVLKNDGENFSGILSLLPQPVGVGYNMIRDTRNLESKLLLESSLVEKVRLTSDSGHVTSVGSKFVEQPSQFFNIFFGTGVSSEIKGTNMRSVVMPIALMHKNANCVHNGVLIFFIEKQNTSDALVQVASETCASLQFNYTGVFQTNYESQPTSPRISNRIRSKDATEQTSAPIEMLYDKYPSLLGALASSPIFEEDKVTLFGLIDEQIHYTSQCDTRAGQYPMCNQLLLPSFSLAKSIAGALSLSLIETQFPYARESFLIDYLDVCRKDKWQNVTFENLSDMATGIYQSKKHYVDEDSPKHVQFIYDQKTNLDKIETACSLFQYRTTPGKRFVYHTSDTYLLGAAMNAFLKKNSKMNDYYSDVLIPYLTKRGFSDALQYSLRTKDTAQQAFTGWGMYFLREDLFLLSILLHEAREASALELHFLRDALNPTQDNSLVAISTNNSFYKDIFYNNGFFSIKLNKSKFNCTEDVWVPFMSGWGGITFVLLPNKMTYYFFSDGHTHSFKEAIFAIHQVRPLC